MPIPAPRTPMNLLDAISHVERQKEEAIAEMERRVAAFDDIIHSLRRANEVCWFCRGEGFKLRPRSCAEDDVDPSDPRDRITCKACHGTGWKHWTDEKGVEHNAQIDTELPRGL